jgi:hypothetical protein
MKKVWKNRNPLEKDPLSIFRKTILCSLRNFNNFTYNKDYTYKASKWFVSITISISWNPSLIIKKDDRKIYFILYLNIQGNTYVYKYNNPCYPFYTIDYIYDFENWLQKWNYDCIMRKLLKEVLREFKYGILTNFVKI